MLVSVHCAAHNYVCSLDVLVRQAVHYSRIEDLHVDAETRAVAQHHASGHRRLVDHAAHRLARFKRTLDDEAWKQNRPHV